MSDTVSRADAGGVATLTLLRPGLSHALRTDLLAAVRDVAADESVRAVVVTGTGRAFCVGQDLAEHVESLRGNAATSLSVVEDEYNPLILALAALRVPVVVGINGACAGAGLGIALAPIVGVLDVSEIVLSGPPELLDGPLAQATVETLRARTLAEFHDGVRVRMTEQGQDIVLRGAAVMVLSGQLGVS